MVRQVRIDICAGRRTLIANGIVCSLLLDMPFTKDTIQCIDHVTHHVAYGHDDRYGLDCCSDVDFGDDE